MNPPRKVLLQFVLAGWWPKRNRKIKVDGIENISSFETACEILKSFGGLRVGRVGTGKDCATSDIEFESCPSILDVEMVANWENQTGPLMPIAYAHNCHLILFLNQESICYTWSLGDLHREHEKIETVIENLILGRKGESTEMQEDFYFQL